jgi:hypothetical protein
LPLLVPLHQQPELQQELLLIVHRLYNHKFPRFQQQFLQYLQQH